MAGRRAATVGASGITSGKERRRTEIETQGRASEAGGKPGQILGDLIGALSGEWADLPAVPGAHRVSGAARRPSDARM